MGGYEEPRGDIRKLSLYFDKAPNIRQAARIVCILVFAPLLALHFLFVSAATSCVVGPPATQLPQGSDL